MKAILSALVVVACMSSSAYAQKGALGITMSDNRPGGVLITKVVDGSPADKIGLQAGDRILEVNGKKTNNFMDVDNIVQALKPGTEVDLTVIRGAWKTKLKATLGASGTVFHPEHKIAAVPKPVHESETNYEPTWQSVFDFSDPNSAAAAYGGGGW